MPKRGWIILTLLLSMGLIFVSGQKIQSSFTWKYPPLNSLVVTEYFSQDLAFLLQGSHRVAADLGYVQLLQYYGDPENYHDDGSVEFQKKKASAPIQLMSAHDHHDHHHEVHHDEPQHQSQHGRPGDIFRPGRYFHLYKWGRRVLRLDPFFNSSALEVAGALAFNLKRTDQAKEFLREAIELDPSFYRYQLYLAAILYKQDGAEDKLVSILDKAIEYSDCPILLETVLANLHKKNRNYVRSGEIYAHIIKTAPGKADRTMAERLLIELIQNHPEITPQIERFLQDS